MVISLWNSSIPQVMVVTSEGSLHVYSIDLESGGECVLQKSYKSVARHRCRKDPHHADYYTPSLMEGIDDSVTD